MDREILGVRGMFKFGKKKGAAAASDDANLPAVTDGETVEGEDAAPKKKKLPLLFIVVPAALVVLGGGGGAAFFLMQPKAEAAESGGHGAEKKGGHGKAEKKGGGGHGAGASGEANPALGVISEGPDGVTFYTLPDMVVNLQTADGRPAHMKLKLTFEMHDAALAEHLQAELPRMNDMFQTSCMSCGLRTSLDRPAASRCAPRYCAGS
ncbi:hypothetical protein, partial [Brevundimonas sp.]|uniref:hypothetical protein n=1 Tax=Brevundimonas sp. TaxID=1871086 RepID=UPI002D4EBC60